MQAHDRKDGRAQKKRDKISVLGMYLASAILVPRSFSPQVFRRIVHSCSLVGLKQFAQRHTRASRSPYVFPNSVPSEWRIYGCCRAGCLYFIPLSPDKTGVHCQQHHRRITTLVFYSLVAKWGRRLAAYCQVAEYLKSSPKDQVCLVSSWFC